MSNINRKFLLWFLSVPLILAVNLFSGLKAWFPYLSGISNIMFAGLMLIWCSTLRTRIIYPPIRHCLEAIAWSLFALFVIRCCRWQFFENSAVMARFFWYLYYLPFLAVPLLSCHAAVNLLIQKKLLHQMSLWAAWICGIVLAAGVLTNELHGQLLRFHSKDDASHGWLYYVVVIWSVLLSLGALTIQLRQCRLSQCRKQTYIPVLMSAVGFLLQLWCYLNGGSPTFLGMKVLFMQEAYALTFIGLWEGCILIGLLPSNTGYRQLFAESHINAVLKDETDTVWYASVQTESSSDPADYVAQTKPLHGGSITWTEDIRRIRSLQTQLAEANEALEAENDLIAEENRITAEHTQYETQNQLYDRIAAHNRKQLARIAESFSDPARFSAQIRQNLLLGTYVKRSANLMLLANTSSRISADELLLAMRETLDVLRLFGIDCTLQGGWGAEVSAHAAAAAYALAEAAAESVCGECSAFCVSVTPDAETLLAIETDVPPFPDTTSVPGQADYTLTESDGTYLLRIGGVRNVS